MLGRTSEPCDQKREVPDMARYRPIPGYEGPYFTTWAVVDWQPVFSRRDAFDVIIDSFKHCQEHKGLRLHAFVVMPTHVHSIASAPDGGKIENLMRDMKSYTAHEIISACEDSARKHFPAAIRGPRCPRTTAQGLAGGIPAEAHCR